MKKQINLHWYASAGALLLLVPLFARSGLPLRVNLDGFLSAYWGLSWESICAAALLLTLQSPREVLGTLARRYWAQKARIPILIVFLVSMLSEFGWIIGLMVVINGVAIGEWFDRAQADLESLKKDAISILIPAAYLFGGLAMMFCYNSAIIAMQDPQTYDATFNRMDSVLLDGWTVSSLVQKASQVLPLPIFKGAEFIYYSVFAWVGAGLVIIALRRGRRRALQFVGSLLVAIYLATLIYWIFPSLGPFAANSTLPHAVGTYTVQQICLLTAQARWHHIFIPMVTLEEYIAFPSLHIALPVIVLWFLRPWKRIAFVLAVYVAVLIPSILLLEWHYFVDLLGGITVAVLILHFFNKEDYA